MSITLSTIAAPPHRHLGDDITSEAWDATAQFVYDLMQTHDVDRHLSTLAPGLDQLTAQIAISLDIPVFVIRPFPERERHWSPRSAATARTIEAIADNVQTISDKPEASAIIRCNRLVAQAADMLVTIDADNSLTVRNAIANTRPDCVILIAKGTEAALHADFCHMERKVTQKWDD